MAHIGQPDEGPAERLLEHTTRILDRQDKVRLRKIQVRTLYGTGFATLISTLAIYVATVSTWRTHDLGSINKVAIPLTVVCGIAFVILAYLEDKREDTKSVRQLQAELEIAEERKLLEAFTLAVPSSQRQFTYKEALPRELERLRSEAQHYRRIHNAFQSLIIMGSIGTTTAASLTDTPSSLKWVTVGLSFGVGVSAGFTGYFKYRERSFYLQQTADAIEQHINAYELGIAPYVGEEEATLAKLAQEVENLRVEQRKREQQLDQPHEGRDGTV
jgi:uncharacterized protein with PQ loop repeat